MSGKPQPGNVAYPAKDRALGLPVERVGARQMTAYNPELALKIVERLAVGELLRDICAEEDMPARVTFMNWVARTPELKSAYLAARELSASSMEEEAISIARGSHESPGTQQKLRGAELAIKQLQWSASRRDPKAFGERAQTNLVVPININTTLDLGVAGAEQMGDSPDIYTIDLTPEVVEPEKAVRPPIGPSPTRKQVLVPRLPMDAPLPRSYSKARPKDDK